MWDLGHHRILRSIFVIIVMNYLSASSQHYLSLIYLAYLSFFASFLQSPKSSHSLLLISYLLLSHLYLYQGNQFEVRRVLVGYWSFDLIGAYNFILFYQIMRLFVVFIILIQGLFFVREFSAFLEFWIYWNCSTSLLFQVHQYSIQMVFIVIISWIPQNSFPFDLIHSY